MGDPQIDVDRLISLMVTDPLRAADELDALAERFKDTANQLRDKALRGNNGTMSPTGIGDRVRIGVIGPNGEVRGYGGIG